MSESNILGEAGGHVAPQNTVVDGSAPAPTPSWKESLSEDIRNSPSLKNFNDVQSLAKSYVHAQSLIGADKIVLPKAGDEKGMRDVFAKLGLPDSVDKYDLKLADGQKMDPKFVGDFKAKALEAGILPNQAQKLLDWYGKSAEDMVKGSEAQKLQAQAQAVEGLKKEWGDGYDKQVSAAQSALKEYADEATANEIRAKYGNDPAVIKLLAKIGNSLGEDKIQASNPNATFGKTPGEAQKQINLMMADANGPYMNASHPGHRDAVAEMESLFRSVYKD